MDLSRAYSHVLSSPKLGALSLYSFTPEGRGGMPRYLEYSTPIRLDVVSISASHVKSSLYLLIADLLKVFG